MGGHLCDPSQTVDNKYVCCQCQLIYQQIAQCPICSNPACLSCFPAQFNNESLLCNNCNTSFPSSQIKIDENFQKTLDSFIIQCFFCHASLILKIYQDHLTKYHQKPKCISCHKNFDSINQHNEHWIHECRHRKYPCKLIAFGCNALIQPNYEHEHVQSIEHQEALMRSLFEKRLPSNCDAINTNAISLLTDSLNPLIDQATRTFKIQAKISQDLDYLQCLHVYSERRSINFVNSMTDIIQLNGKFLKKSVTSLTEQSTTEEILKDGFHTWKITDVDENFHEALSDRKTSIYSKPFYTTPWGYRCRLRLYLNGDGSARGTHVSVFFVLMRGLYDSILEYPFKFKVSFCLCDQSGAGKHIIDSFNPDINSNSFQRCQYEMNIASGIPKFAPISVLQPRSPYVIDNTIFIRTLIHFENTPRIILPFIFSFDLGLSAHDRRILIQKRLSTTDC